jgi:hypothetical protein
LFTTKGVVDEPAKRNPIRGMTIGFKDEPNPLFVSGFGSARLRGDRRIAARSSHCSIKIKEFEIAR